MLISIPKGASCNVLARVGAYVAIRSNACRFVLDARRDCLGALTKHEPDTVVLHLIETNATSPLFDGAALTVSKVGRALLAEDDLSPTGESIQPRKGSLQQRSLGGAGAAPALRCACPCFCSAWATGARRLLACTIGL